MRVGMHAGPVLVGWDPVVRHENFFGPHVLYAQLIEPITTPGCAFATAQFAACLATSPESQEFKLDYVGSCVLETEFAASDYAELSGKEKRDFSRCHLYNLVRFTRISSGCAEALAGHCVALHSLPAGLQPVFSLALSLSF